jgi:hypothetical protein
MAAFYTFEDLSGASSNGVKSDNPYQDVIDACENNAVCCPFHVDLQPCKTTTRPRSKKTSSGTGNADHT